MATLVAARGLNVLLYLIGGDLAVVVQGFVVEDDPG
jgi:hypothetical protein